jgi:Co/Zn/Cd efflux system component
VSRESRLPSTGHAEHGEPHADGHETHGHDHDHDPHEADGHTHDADEAGGHSHDARDGHGHGPHGHSHGLIDRSIMRSREGLRAVGLSLAVLLATALVQGAIFLATGSVALLADLIHNFGDALTAIPLGIAFVMRSFTAERRAGYFVVATILVSACVAAGTAVDRLLHPQALHHLVVLAVAGVVGFLGNEIAARIRLRAGARLHSAALIADGNHARTDALVSLAVVASSIVVGLGFRLGDPLIGLTITIVILRITWQSFLTIRADVEPGGADHGPHDEHGDPTGDRGASGRLG